MIGLKVKLGPDGHSKTVDVEIPNVGPTKELEIISYKMLFKEYLHENDWHRNICRIYFRELQYISDYFEKKKLYFQNKTVSKKLCLFVSSADKFLSKYVEYTGASETNIDYDSVVAPGTDYYGPRHSEYKGMVDELGPLAEQAWDALSDLEKTVRDEIPEVLGDEFKAEWIRSKELS